MPARAFVVAVEKYPAARDIAGVLAGTMASAREFIRWLIENQGMNSKDIFFCHTDTTHGPNEFPATKDGFVDAFEALLKAGTDDTSRLFVWLSGHGVQVEQQGWLPPRDLLILNDFVASDRSGDRVVFLDELRYRLARGLGPGVQFCFVDACRSGAPPGFIPQGLPFAVNDSQLGAACSHLLMSARPGDTAAANSKFSKALLDALNGNAGAEIDASGRAWITLQKIAEHIGEAAESPIDVLRGCLDENVATYASPNKANVTPQRHWLPPTQTGQVPMLGRDAGGKKVPPVELLTYFDRVIFLGETNGQLPAFVREAAGIRNTSWTRIDLFSLEDLSNHSRPGRTQGELEAERNAAEAELASLLDRHSQSYAIYRYEHVGFYGSLWQHDATGLRRVHTSIPIPGIDIRATPGVDLVEVQWMPSEIVQHYFSKAAELIAKTAPMREKQYVPE